MATTAMTLCLLLLFSFSLSSVEAQTETTATALYVFGDSTVDDGNNNHLDTPAKANSLPYGIDFNNTPTGRFTNGKTTADFLAMFLGLPLVPPYLGLSEDERKNLTTGINYASGGCGILPETGEVSATNCLMFDKQIDFFNDTLKNDLPNIIENPEELLQYLSEAIFFISIGGNDYAFNYIPPAMSKWSSLSPQDFSKFLLEELSKRLERLYELGARKFLVNNIGPMGCLPDISKGGECNETVNQMVLPFSDNLPLVLKELQSSTLYEAKFSNPNNFEFLARVKENQEENGITNRKDPCWPPKSTTFCEDRDHYFFFDGVHTTQASNLLFSLDCFNGTLCCPQNVEALVRA